MDSLEFLSHHGIKGMRWGVRRKNLSVVDQLNANTKMMRRGLNDGERGDKLRKKMSSARVSTEAKRADEILAKAKKHGGKSLTNKELGDLNKRLQLEQQFNKLVPAKKSAIKTGLNATKEILNTGRTVNDAIAFANSPAGKLIKESIVKR